MFKLSKALNAEQLEDYHKNEYSSPTAQYWSQGNTVAGEWAGDLAKKIVIGGFSLRPSMDCQRRGRDAHH
jgi:hypothetical protein